MGASRRKKDWEERLFAWVQVTYPRSLPLWVTQHYLPKLLEREDKQKLQPPPCEKVDIIEMKLAEVFELDFCTSGGTSWH